MTSLVAPLWINPQRIGLTSAVENAVDGYINLTFGDSLPVAPATTDYYNIYHSLNVNTLYNSPKFITKETSVSFPPTLLTLDQYITVRTAQYGVSNDISSPNLVGATDNVVVFPSATTLRKQFGISDGYMVVNDATGYPRKDGYALVGTEIVLYSDVVDGYDGYDGLLISNRDPYSCNVITVHMDGYAVSLYKGVEDGNLIRAKTTDSCGLPLPSWPGEIGVTKVNDSGIGTSVEVFWNDAQVPVGFGDIFYNVYNGNSARSLGTSSPIGFSSSLSAIVPNLNAGATAYFSVKASYHLANVVTTGFTQLSSGFFAYPKSTTIQDTDGYLNSGQTGIVLVADTTGYPLAGYLHIGSEVLQYSSLTSNSFNILRRDVLSMGKDNTYPNGTSIHFFRGLEESNRNFYRSVPTWAQALETPKLNLPDGYNGYLADGYVAGTAYNQDIDGYRSIRLDSINENHANFEDEKKDDDLLGTCLYHRENWDDLFSRNQGGTYSGGRQYKVLPGVNNGSPVAVGGGIDAWGHATRTQEDLLGKTGDFFILLSRKWTGKKCSRLSLNTEHPEARCSSCYGTTFEGGYDRYVNERALRQGQLNPNGFIAMRIQPYDDDVELNQYEGLKQTVILSAWTISIPLIRDRDIVIHYIYDFVTKRYIESFRYEVMKARRNKLLFNQFGKQTLSLKRLEDTREIYKFPNPIAGSLIGIPN